MSIVLPGDSPVGRPLQTEAERDRENVPLFARIRKLGLWQFLTRPHNIPESPDLKEPTGKIRIVSNRWDDRSGKYRCNNDNIRETPQN